MESMKVRLIRIFKKSDILRIAEAHFASTVWTQKWIKEKKWKRMMKRTCFEIGIRRADKIQKKDARHLGKDTKTRMNNNTWYRFRKGERSSSKGPAERLDESRRVRSCLKKRLEENNRESDELLRKNTKEEDCRSGILSRNNMRSLPFLPFYFKRKKIH